MAGRGRPKKDATLEEKKTPEQIKQETLNGIKAQMQEKKEELATLQAQWEIEHLDEEVKKELLEKQDNAIRFIKLICTIDGINDVLKKLGIEVIAQEETAESEEA